MVGVVAGTRRSALVLVVVVGMMVALFTVCCCLELDHVSAADPVPAAIAAHSGASQDVRAGHDGGHSEQDCQESVASVAVGSASVPGPLDAAALAVAPMAGQATPWAGAPGREVPPPPPVPHLLCVMRT